MQNSNRKFGEFAILDEFTKVREGLLLAVRDELDHVEHRLYYGTLEVVATFVSQDTRKEREHGRVFGWELEAERPDGVDDDDLEFIADLSHKASDLLNETVDGGFISSL